MTGYRDDITARTIEDVRLETPSAVGYRSGMSSTSLIGRRLSRVYDVASDLPRDMGTLLLTLDRKADNLR